MRTVGQFLLLSALCGVVAGFGWRAAGGDVEQSVGPGYVHNFTVACGTTPTSIGSSRGQRSYSAFVDDGAGADVYFGDTSVTTSTGTPKGAGESIGGDVRFEYCVVASGSETVRVRALVSSLP